MIGTGCSEKDDDADHDDDDDEVGGRDGGRGCDGGGKRGKSVNKSLVLNTRSHHSLSHITMTTTEKTVATATIAVSPPQPHGRGW